VLSIRLRLNGYVRTKDAVLAISQLHTHSEYRPFERCCIIIECVDITGFSPGALNYLSRVQRDELPNQQMFLVNRDMNFSVKVCDGRLQLV